MIYVADKQLVTSGTAFLTSAFPYFLNTVGRRIRVMGSRICGFVSEAMMGARQTCVIPLRYPLGETVLGLLLGM